MTPEEEKNKTDAVQTPPEDPKQATNPEPPQQMDPPPKDEKSRSRPVKVYLTVMFCVALLLLLISFVMQQRNHLALQDLNQSISVSQDVADLQMENQKLQYELKEKEDQAGDLQAQLEKAEKQALALEWLRRIEAAVRTSYPEARTLVEEFEKTGLESSLPTESVIEGGTAPAEAYRSIYAMLF